MISQSKGWSFYVGFLVAFLLVSAACARYLLPMFQWFFVSSRDVMYIWFMVFGFFSVGWMAWYLSPAYTWLAFAYILSSVSYGFKGNTVTDTTMLMAGIALLVFLSQAWKYHKQYIYYGLLVGIIINILVGLMQAFGSDLGVPAPSGLVFRDPFFAMHFKIREIEGLATHYSLLTGFLIVAIPLLITRYRYGFLLLFPTLYFIWFAQHRTTALCLVFFTLLIPQFKYRKQTVIAILLLTLIFAGSVLYLRGSFTSNFSGGNFSPRAFMGDRDTIWVVTLAKALQEPIVGWGPGTFGVWKPTVFNEQSKTALMYLQAHNEYLQVLFETGFIGFFSFIIFGVWLFYRLWKARPWSYELRGAVCSLACLALISFVSFPFRIGMTAFGGILTLVALHGALGEKTSDIHVVSNQSQNVVGPGNPSS